MRVYAYALVECLIVTPAGMYVLLICFVVFYL